MAYSETRRSFNPQIQRAQVVADYLIAHFDAKVPLVKVAGGRNVTEQFFDNDNACAKRAGCGYTTYEFISGEPYSSWN